MVRSPSLGRAVLLLLQQLHQRSKRRRRQSHAPLQSREQAGKAALGNDLAGALPPRAHKPGPSYASAQFAKEDAAQKLAAKGQNRRKALEAAMNRLFAAKKIKVENYGNRSPSPRKGYVGCQPSATRRLTHTLRHRPEDSDQADDLFVARVAQWPCFRVWHRLNGTHTPLPCRVMF